MLTFDVSRLITPTEALGQGDDPLESWTICDVGEADPCRITSLENWTTHFLTHVDAPRHFFDDGATLDQLPLERFAASALVVDVGDALVVTPTHVPDADLAGLAVLFKTTASTWDTRVFHPQHPYVGVGAARELVARGANIVGIDYLSVDRFGDDEYPAHKTLLASGVIVLEGLDLAEIEAGEYELVAYPLRIHDADGSPVRAVLRR
ncbi:cyclase family protein [Microbacterium sp. SS28]|uniref:cyclase family protein n=1 Tax=Microbacterium sp. SS28 TaxID=2919948 RepID=UPI001FAA92D1|nr:cyclase family protein [Microbacterium sp. SS28]